MTLRAEIFTAPVADRIGLRARPKAGSREAMTTQGQVAGGRGARRRNGASADGCMGFLTLTRKNNSGFVANQLKRAADDCNAFLCADGAAERRRSSQVVLRRGGVDQSAYICLLRQVCGEQNLTARVGLRPAVVALVSKELEMRCGNPDPCDWRPGWRSLYEAWAEVQQ